MANEWIKKTGVAIHRFRNRDAIALRTAGDRARDQRDWPDAIERYSAYLEKQPGDAAIWVQLGHAHKEWGGYDEARAAYTKALALTPEDADLQLNMGHLAKVTGDLDEAAYRYVVSYRIDANAAAAREIANPDLQLHLLAADARLAEKE